MSSRPHTVEPRISEALERLRASQAGPRLSLGDLLDALGDRGFGLLILVLALPNAIPGPTVPGFSLVFGIGLVALGAQLALGWDAPRIPRRARAWSVSSAGFARFLDRVLPWIRHIERWLTPRPSWLVGGAGARLIGVAVILMSMVLSLPVPLGNVPVASSLVILALGLLEEDGIALLLGLVLGTLSIAWNALLVAGGTLALERVFPHLL